MKAEQLFQLLVSYNKCHDLCEGLSEEAISSFEKSNSITLPSELKSLYRVFDGGEIFVPGTLIYGINQSSKRKTLREANSKVSRGNYTIPSNYLVVAKLNFGDLICVYLNNPFNVIQWDHETDEQYCFWDSLFEWLEESIKEYKDYEEGAN